jgi:23S rRNA pseudouridine2605 synthase
VSDKPAASADGDRLAKVIARAGLCSRRDAEGWIKDGRVSVNGSVIRTPAFNVSDKDDIKVDGRALAERRGTRVWLYHKPAGLVVTEKDPEGRETIFEKLAAEGLPRVLTVGRLDINTEGLLLLTNDGGLKRVLELPATGWLRRYRVRAFGTVSQLQLDNLKNGVEVEGIKYGPIEATIEREQGDNVWLVVALREGKNREVKNVLASMGLVVNRLIRVSYGPFQLGDLPIGAVETVRSKVLRDQLGARLAREAGVDFESEMPDRRKADPADEEPAPRRDRPGRGPEFARRPPRTAKEPERPAGRPRKIHFDDGRAPAEFVEKSYGAKKPREDKPEGKSFDKGDRPRRAAGEGPKRDFKDGPKPDFKDRPKRDFKDGLKQDFKPGPKGDFKDRPKRDFKDSPKREFREGAKPAFKSGPKPAFKAGPKRDFADRPKRAFSADGPRPERKDRPPRPAGDRPRSPRPDGDRPRAPRSASDRPGGDRARPPRPAGDRPRGPRPTGGAPRKPGGPRPPRPPGGAPRGPRPRGPKKTRT